MKKLLFLLGLVVSMTAIAGEAVIDTGKGGLRAVLTIEGMGGPYDFAKNKGPRVYQDPRLAGGEARFSATIEGTTAVSIYQLLVMHEKDIRPGDKPITAEHLANEMLETNGFKLERAVKIDGPEVAFPGVSVATYKASGNAIFEQERKGEKWFMIVQGVSFPGNTMGYAIMATVVEKTPSAFDADPALYEKRAKGGFVQLFKGLQFDKELGTGGRFRGALFSAAGLIMASFPLMSGLATTILAPSDSNSSAAADMSVFVVFSSIFSTAFDSPTLSMETAPFASENNRGQTTITMSCDAPRCNKL